MLVMHGACFAALKADHAIAVRAVAIARWTTLVFAVLYVLAGVWLACGIPGYAIRRPGADRAAFQSAVQAGRPRQQLVCRHMQYPWFWAAPLLALASAVGVQALVGRRSVTGFIASSLMVGSTIASAGFALFPFLLPSVSTQAFQPHRVGRLVAVAARCS